MLNAYIVLGAVMALMAKHFILKTSITYTKPPLTTVPTPITHQTKCSTNHNSSFLRVLSRAILSRVR